MRLGFDRLAAVVAGQLGESPQSGALYVFFGKRPIRVKVLWWDVNGYCLLSKRLHRAHFQFPKSPQGHVMLVDGQALTTMLRGVTRIAKIKNKKQPLRLLP